MIIDSTMLDKLTIKAQASPRLRANFDLRNTEEDCFEVNEDERLYWRYDRTIRESSLRTIGIIWKVYH